MSLRQFKFGRAYLKLQCHFGYYGHRSPQCLNDYFAGRKTWTQCLGWSVFRSLGAFGAASAVMWREIEPLVGRWTDIEAGAGDRSLGTFGAASAVTWREIEL